MVATVYVDLFRGVPLILVIYAVGFGLPALRLTVISTQPLAVYGVIALTLSYSAYVSEVYRAGLNSVHRSQVAAARSLGLSQATALRYVILPQAVRNIIPPLLHVHQPGTPRWSACSAPSRPAAQIYASTVFNYSSSRWRRFSHHRWPVHRRLITGTVRRLAGATAWRSAKASGEQSMSRSETSRPRRS